MAASLAAVPCSHAACIRNMVARSGSTSREGGLARHSSVLSWCRWIPRREFDLQAGAIWYFGLSASPVNFKAPMVRAAKFTRARGGKAAQAAHKPGRQPGATQDTSPVAKVTFQLKHQVHFGQELFVVGSSPELGQWDLQAALPLTWTEGHVWKAEKAVGVGQKVEYKFVITSSDGGVEWQSGDNRIFETKDADDVMVSGPWNALDEVNPDALGEVTAEVIPEAAKNVPFKSDREVTVEVDPEAAAAFNNGIAPGTDAVEGILTSVELIVNNVQESAGKILPSATKKLKETAAKNGKAGEPSEISAVDAIVATAIEEDFETSEELVTHSTETSEPSQAEVDNESGGAAVAQQEDGIGETSQEPESAVKEAMAKVDGLKSEPFVYLASTKAIVDNDWQWLTRTFGSKSKRTKR